MATVVAVAHLPARTDAASATLVAVLAAWVAGCLVVAGWGVLRRR